MASFRILSIVAIAMVLPLAMGASSPCLEKAFTADYIYTQGRLGMMGNYAIDYDNRGVSMNLTGITEEGDYFEGRLLVTNEKTYWMTTDECHNLGTTGASHAFDFRCFDPKGQQYPVTIAGVDAFVYRTMATDGNETSPHVYNATSFTFTRDGNLPITLAVILPRGSLQPHSSNSYFMTCQFLNPRKGVDSGVFAVPANCANAPEVKPDRKGHSSFFAALHAMMGAHH